MIQLKIQLKMLFSKSYWKYIFSIKKAVYTILSTLGVIWLLVEATSFFSEELSTFFKDRWDWLLIVGVLWVLYENRPQTQFCFKLKNRDIKIQISIGDIFKHSGDIVVPINTSFDTSFQNGLISQKSIQGQFTIKYFGEPRYLDQDIQGALVNQDPLETLPAKQRGNNFRYEIGKIIKLQLKNNTVGYLSAISDMNNTGNAQTTFDNLLVSLGTLWAFLIEEGELGELNIPLVGTGRGRLIETRETVVKAIIHSFISATSQGRRFCDKLNIVIYPKDFSEHDINIRELRDFLKLKCIHYEYDTTLSGRGETIG